MFVFQISHIILYGILNSNITIIIIGNTRKKNNTLNQINHNDKTTRKNTKQIKKYMNNLSSLIEKNGINGRKFTLAKEE